MDGRREVVTWWDLRAQERFKGNIQDGVFARWLSFGWMQTAKMETLPLDKEHFLFGLI